MSIEQSVDILVRDPCRNPFYIGTLSDDYFIEYVYGSDPVDLIIDNFKVDPPVCPITYECQSASGCDIPGVSSFNAGRFTFETNNRLRFPVGDYVYQIKASSGVDSVISTFSELTLRIREPCEQTKIMPRPGSEEYFKDMSYILGDPGQSQELEIK